MMFNELNTKQKPRMGSGTYKDVYNLSTRPDLVIKVFDRLSNESIYDVQEEEQLGKKYPDLFAKIEKVNYEKGYMIQQKLDVDKFRKDVDSLKQEIVFETPSFSNIDIVAYLFRHLENNNKDAIKVIKDILKDNNNKKFYNKLITYLSKLSKVKREMYGIDANRENFGYDKQDNIKILDI
jgi:hypothetical protein